MGISKGFSWSPQLIPISALHAENVRPSLLLLPASVPFLIYSLQLLHSFLKEPDVIETWAFPGIGYVLLTAKTQVKIYFVQ